MSVPLEWVEGLPVGIHFAAAPGADRTLLELAYQLEGRPTVGAPAAPPRRRPTRSGDGGR